LPSSRILQASFTEAKSIRAGSLLGEAALLDPISAGLFLDDAVDFGVGVRVRSPFS